MQGDARGCMGRQGGQASSSQGRLQQNKAGFSRPRQFISDWDSVKQTMAPQSIVISAVLPAYPMHFPPTITCTCKPASPPSDQRMKGTQRWCKGALEEVLSWYSQTQTFPPQPLSPHNLSTIFKILPDFACKSRPRLLADWTGGPVKLRASNW